MMTKRSTAKMTKLRRGTQDILERRSMAASPSPLAPQLHTDNPTAARTGAYFGDDTFSHGGRRTFAATAPPPGLAHHAELPGHRHRGAEKHSAH
ncbi:hypothetical protein AB0K43_20845 [Kitasatospora sp. NPDC049258]|uniref:hypothetical protein n=1 Tax=Kitasatospora sp. NPDC049258 TaxID=3155394 RepID=UPI0034450400